MSATQSESISSSSDAFDESATKEVSTTDDMDLSATNVAQHSTTIETQLSAANQSEPVDRSRNLLGGDRSQPDERSRYRKPILIVYDELLHCCDCSQEFHGDCPKHGSLTIVKDTLVECANHDNRAAVTAPPQVSVEEYGVRARKEIPARTRFGPLEGIRVPIDEATPGYSWLVRKNGEGDHCIDTSDATTSNWMRHVNCVLQFGQHNLEAIQHYGHIYFTSTRRIKPKEELLVWSGDKPENPGRKAVDWAFIPEKNPSLSSEEAEVSKEQCSCQVPWECPQCIGDVFDVELLKADLRFYVDGKCFVCSDCNKRFLVLDDLSEHVRSGCEITAFPESSKEILRSSDSAVETPFCCVEFKNDFPLPCSSNDHHLKVHKEVKRFACTHCNKSFCKKAVLTRHLRIHSGEKPFACSECGKQFIQKHDLKRHFRSHSGEMPFVCSDCGKRFLQESDLTKHLRIHVGEKLGFTCSECGKQFTRKGNFISHLRSHTGERPFACDLCDKRFFRCSYLTKHMRTHTEEKLHICPHCDKSFFRKSNLSRHRRSRICEKSFSCQECGKKFSRAAEFSEHEQTHRK